MTGAPGSEPPLRRPSLRKKLLAFLLTPTLVLMLVAAGFVYFVALRYSNYVHDRDLDESTVGLANALSASRSDGRLTPEARQLLEFNPGGGTFFSVASLHHGFVSGDTDLAAQSSRAVAEGHSEPFDTIVDGKQVRVAINSIVAPRDSHDRLIVSIAETLHDRQKQAREILLLTIPVEALLIAGLMVLVWQGVRFGLRSLDAPIRRLEARERELAPISGPDIPVEILPLTKTIDGLFERVAGLVDLQERFVADAAHQLRTPLAGLSMHAEHALMSARDARTVNALEQITKLAARMTRSATQLLALARLQVPADSNVLLSPVNLSDWLPQVVSLRIPEALKAGIDLGFETTCTTAVVAAEQSYLQDLIDNVIDNAFSFVPHVKTITVSLRMIDGDRAAQIAIDDDGPGVAEEFMQRLGERFFRAPGAPNGGSGLGLAIVRRIVNVHNASLRFDRSVLGGLRVEVQLPAKAARPTGDAS